MQMRILKTILIAGIICLSSIHMANSATLGFDDITIGKLGSTPVVWNYNGLNWFNFRAADGEDKGGGYENGMVSTDNVVYNGGGMLSAIYNANAFTFNDAYFTAADNENLILKIYGFNLDLTKKNLLDEIKGGDFDKLFKKYGTAPNVLTLNTTAPIRYSDNFDAYKDINLLVFASSGGTHQGCGLGSKKFVMDNFTYNEPIPVDPTPAPEPSTLILGFLGLGGLLGARKKN